MPSDAVRKKCRDCKRVQTGSKARMQWCECGGEMIAIPYGSRRRKTRRAS